MWKSEPSLNKYEYVSTNPYLIRLIAIAGVLATLSMGYGFWLFVQLNAIYLFLFGPIVLIVVLNKFLRYVLQVFYPQFNIQEHEKFVYQFWKKNEEPLVDVFLPWAGEDLEMHEEVVKGVSLLDYKNFQVYMLDDKGNKEHQALAKKYGFNYLSRPNKGEYKKSGNLEYGYKHAKGKFVFILDADFIPATYALRELIPYLIKDPEIGILQTPQYFEQSHDIHARSKIEFGGGNIVEEFYKIMMPCRDEFKAAMCVGTSAIYRKEVIEKLDGTPKVHASEDLATGLTITRFGYYVKYLPLIVSIGKSPDSFQGYFKQHQRWCSGNIVFAQYWPKARLSLMARLIYLTNPFYYLSEALSIIFSFQFILLLYFHTDSLSIWNTLYFIPYILVSRLVVPGIKTNKNKMGTRLAALNNTYTYFYTYLYLIFKGVPSWHPTGLKVKGLHPDYLNAFNLGTIISSIYILSLLFVLLSKPDIFGNYNTYTVLGWSFYSLSWHVLFLTFVAEYIHPFRISSMRHSFDVILAQSKRYAVLILFFVLMGSSALSAFNGLSDPSAPTLVAVKNIGKRDTTNLAMLSPEPNFAVLGAATSFQYEDRFEILINENFDIEETTDQVIYNIQLKLNRQLSESEITILTLRTLSMIQEQLTTTQRETISLDLNLLAGTILFTNQS